MFRRPTPLLALALALAPLLLTACFTGQRPSFADDSTTTGGSTGDAAIDAVVSSLESNSVKSFTATYDVLVKFGNTTRTATVVVDGSRRSIRVGDVHYVFDGDAATSCAPDGTCTDGLNAALISDTGVTVDFYSTDTAQRLRRDSLAKIAPTITRTQTIADQTANCVDVPVTGGTAVYCVLAGGPLALLDDGDVRVVLTALSSTADPAAFTP